MSVLEQIETGASNFVNGEWRRSACSESADVFSPATSEVLATVPLARQEDVDAAVSAAADAYPDWRRTTPQDCIQCLFKFKRLLEEHTDDMDAHYTRKRQDVHRSSCGTSTRDLEVEVICGIPTLMQGYNSKLSPPAWTRS